MSRGGARLGAGRKAHALTEKTSEIALTAGTQGLSPVEVGLDMMRYYYNLAIEGRGTLTEQWKLLAAEARNGQFSEARAKTIQLMTTLPQMAQSCAIAMAPYVHPRLAPLEVYVPAKNGMKRSDQVIPDDRKNNTEPTEE